MAVQQGASEMVKRDVFVIMPFSSTKTCTEDEWTEIYESVFRPAIEDCGYRCERALPGRGSLIRSIIEKLRNAKIVLADITDRNSNVLYELGVRHSLSKRTIIVSQKEDDIPSDLKGYWSVIYGIRPAQVRAFRADMRRLISEIEENLEKSDSPVSDFLDYEMIGVRNYLVRENVKRLNALFTELSANINTLREVEKDSRYKELLSYDCLGLLLNTLYLDVGLSLLRKCYQLRYALMNVRSGYRLQKEFLQENIELANAILAEVMDIRQKLSIGQFSEPDRISIMVWEPLGSEDTVGTAEGESLRLYSKPAGLSEIDPEDLRRHFENLGRK